MNKRKVHYLSLSNADKIAYIMSHEGCDIEGRSRGGSLVWQYKIWNNWSRALAEYADTL